MKSKLLYFVGVALLALLTNTTQAAIIDISGTGDPSLDGRWEISTLNGTFLEHRSALEAQAWWGTGVDGPARNSFAAGLGAALGFPNVLSDTISVAPYFAYEYLPSFASVRAYAGSNAGTIFSSSFLDRVSYTFAIGRRVASPISVPEPGTLALLGLGLVGMGMRRRIKAS